MNFSGIADKEFQAAVEAAHAETLPKLMALNCAYVKNGEIHHLLNTLQVYLSNTMRTTAGRAHIYQNLGSGMISLHYRLLKTNPAEIRSTYIHELAHIVANLIYKKNVGHSRRWVNIAIALGDDGGRCHKMDTSEFQRPRAPQARVEFECECKTWQLTKQRLKRHLEHKARTGRCAYSCRKCKASLEVVPMALVAYVEQMDVAA